MAGGELIQRFKQILPSKKLFKKSFFGWRTIILLLPLIGLHVSLANGGQLDFGKFIHLEEGMSEGEVFTKAGFPDRVIYSEDIYDDRRTSLRQLFYIPEEDAQDPYLTVITIRDGRVLKLKRSKIFSAPRIKYGGQMDFGMFMRLELGMSEGEVLARAGMPDREVWIGGGFRSGLGFQRQFHYIPTREDPDPHLTVITIQSGKVAHLERTKIFAW